MIEEHENVNEEVLAPSADDFAEAIIEDPAPDPDIDPEKGNEKEGGNEEPGGEEGTEEPSGDDTQQEEPAKEEKEGFVDIEDTTRLEIDGKPVLFKELVAKYKNDKEWQKTNTQKAQEIAEQRKALDRDMLIVNSHKGIVKLIKENPAVANSLKEHFAGDQNALKAIEQALTADDTTLVNPLEQTVNDLQQKLQIIEAEKQFKEAENDVRIKYQLTDSQVDEINEIIFSEYKNSKATLSHETAYKIWRADNIDNPKPIPPEKPKGTKASGTPKTKGVKGPWGGNYDATVEDFADAMK